MIGSAREESMENQWRYGGIAMGELAYLNGNYMPIECAKIPVEDRGLQFGDSLYEVIRLYGGAPFRAGGHLERMRAGARVVGLPEDCIDVLPEVVEELARRSGFGDAFVYIQVTRGVCPRIHAFPSGLQPTVIGTVRPFDRLPEELYVEGATAYAEPDIRWGRRDVKATTLLPNILAATRVARKGGYDAVLVEEDGTITEGTVSNLFAVIDGILRTHPVGERILSGITRAAVIEAASNKGVEVLEESFRIQDLDRATELFFTNTYCEVLPVVRVDDHVVGEGAPGPVSRTLLEGFRDIVRRETGSA